MYLNDPRITQIERTGYLNEPESDLICERCEEIIAGDDRYFEMRGVTYCEECLWEAFGRMA